MCKLWGMIDDFDELYSDDMIMVVFNPKKGDSMLVNWLNLPVVTQFSHVFGLKDGFGTISGCLPKITDLWTNLRYTYKIFHVQKTGFSLFVM